VSGSDFGDALARGFLLLVVLAFIGGIAIAVGSWALWHFVLSHIHWSWA
jgi:hypothetical protein